jgi:hypothetical protein
MLTRWADGNISVEATTQSGNIFPEATRTLSGIDSVSRQGEEELWSASRPSGVRVHLDENPLKETVCPVVNLYARLKLLTWG